MLFVPWLVFSILVGAYASSKGRSSIAYFLISMVLSPILGLAIALAAEPDTDKLEQRAIDAGKRRKCPYCAELVKNEARICKHCGKEIAKIIPFGRRRKS